MRSRQDAFNGSIGHAVTLGLLALLIAGCGYQPNMFDEHGIGRPRPRVGRYATATVGGATFTEIEDLGLHKYYSAGNLEGNGIIYTCRAGHIDLAHVRKSADWTAYIAERTYALMQKGQTHLRLLLSDPVHHSITIHYPCDWDERPLEERDRLAREASIALGQYVSFLGSTWHEIITWFGYRNIPIYSEFPSSFSWEDSFSDLLGTTSGAALRDTEHSFDKAMTLILDAELEKLGAQPKAIAAQASRQVEGQWYSPGFLFLVDMKKRHFDIGLDDGAITPWIVPDLDACPNAKAQPYAVPTLEPVFDLGFDVKVEIEPGGLERNRLLRAAYPNIKRPPRSIVPAVHLHPIMAHIKAEAMEKYGPDVDVPWPDEQPVQEAPTTP